MHFLWYFYLASVPTSVLQRKDSMRIGFHDRSVDLVDGIFFRCMFNHSLLSFYSVGAW